MAGDNAVLIIGGGVAGLVLAQGLKRRGVPFKVFERGAKASTKGYRFRVVDQGVDALQRTLPPELWDLLEETHPRSSPPHLLFVDAVTGAEKGKMMSKDGRSYPMDRPWLEQLLHTGIEEHIVFDKAFEGFKLLDGPGDRRGVRATFADQTTATGRLLVAADGVRSKVRAQFLPESRLLDVERTVMWGRTPLDTTFEARFARPDILSEHFATLLDPVDPRRCCLFAPVRWPHGGKLSQVTGGSHLTDQADYLFWALSFETPPEGTSLRSAGERLAYAREITRAWSENHRAMFELQSESSAIPVWSCAPDVPVWTTDDRVTLMGDAIHCMSPSGGSGGLAAIVDAAELADALGASFNGDDSGEGRWGGLGERLEGYEREMRVRAKGAIEWSFQGGKMIWAGKSWDEYKEVSE